MTSQHPHFVDVLIYGLRRRSRIRGLIDQLAAIPCVPHTMYTIDRMGRELVIYDGLQIKHTLYVRVLTWDPAVAIEWTIRPQTFRRNMKAQAEKRIHAAKTTLGNKPMRYKLDLLRHAELTVKACKNAL